MVPRRFADGKVGRAEREWMHAVQSRTAPSSLLDAADLLMGAELSDAFGQIACPVLLLHPDSSPFLPMAVAADLLEEILALIEEIPDITLGELADHLYAAHGLTVAQSTVWRLLDRHGMTFKKNRARQRAATS